MRHNGRFPADDIGLATRAAVLPALFVAAGILTLADPVGEARSPPKTHRLTLEHYSSHGCSQSFASQSFHGSVELTLRGPRATLVLSGKLRDSFGPSPGRYRQGGQREPARHTTSTIGLTWTGAASQKGSLSTLMLSLEPPRCVTNSGYTSSTEYACKAPASLTLRCQAAQAPVYPAANSAGSKAHPTQTERPSSVTVLVCQPMGKDLGLLGRLLFDDGLPMTPGPGLVHHHWGDSIGGKSILRHPGKQP